MTPDERARVVAAAERLRLADESPASEEVAYKDAHEDAIIDDLWDVVRSALTPLTPEEIEEAARAIQEFNPNIGLRFAKHYALAAIMDFLRSRGLDTTKGGA